MNPQDQPSRRLESLLHALFDRGLTPEQGRELDELLRADPVARRTYLRFADLQANLERHLVARDAGPTGSASRSRQNFLLAESESSPPSASDSSDAIMGVPYGSDPATDADEEMVTPPSLFRAPSALEAVSPLARAWKRLGAIRPTPTRWAALLVLGLSLGAILWSLSRRHPSVVLVSAFDAEWDTPGGPLRPGDALPAGHLRIRTGTVQLKLPGGTTMIVEGPAQFEVTSATGVSLVSGKLSATVPHEVLGFTVQTPSALITDLGTEFGVDAGPDQTQVEVFQGRVRAESVTSDSVTPQQQILVTGESAQITAGTVTLDPAGANPQHFVKNVAADFTSFDLVDLLAGGDGTTTKKGMVLDVANARLDSTPPTLLKGDHQYHPVVGIPAVDGCFVPDGTPGTMQVDSDGDVFQFPRTNNLGVTRIWANDGPPWPGDKMRMSLGGVNYSTNGHRAIHVPSNSAITIDLAVLRRLHPGVNLTAFRAIVGNTSDQGRQLADVFVLARWQQRYARRGFTPQDGPAQVLVSLQPSDRFLTLATTDGGDGEPRDWIIFADPHIDCESK